MCVASNQQPVRVRQCVSVSVCRSVLSITLNAMRMCGVKTKNQLENQTKIANLAKLGKHETAKKHTETLLLLGRTNHVNLVITVASKSKEEDESQRKTVSLILTWQVSLMRTLISSLLKNTLNTATDHRPVT